MLFECKKSTELNLTKPVYPWLSKNLALLNKWIHIASRFLLPHAIKVLSEAHGDSFELSIDLLHVQRHELAGRLIRHPAWAPCRIVLQKPIV